VLVASRDEGWWPLAWNLRIVATADCHIRFSFY
jgi:hypothetical protein